ncbi:hypothetical protein [Burkholderia stabilis]|uniref:hypothetical protein n=1 Tax=Burkholderia stabilis TaxID=95485 RepID=UPI001FC8E547|nr:hypothetical protein [Burkholderia stabilis]
MTHAVASAPERRARHPGTLLPEPPSMSTALLLRTTRSHLYPGSIVTFGKNAPRIGEPHPAVIEFADGSGASATLARLDDDTLELAVDTYVTQKCHAIVAKRWLLRPEDAARTTWRVAKRIADART